MKTLFPEALYGTYSRNTSFRSIRGITLMRIKLLQKLLAVTFLLSPLQAFACQPPPSNSNFSDLRNDVITATVSKVTPESGATNGNPPTVELVVDEVLRGSSYPGRIKVIWGADWPGTIGDKEMRSWKNLPRSAPPPGTRLILLVRRDGSSYWLSKPTQVYSQAALDRTRRLMMVE
ncbi:MAG: hypothetical protein AB7W16_17470 [Candidatus Obscuribacterales bacterium]